METTPSPGSENLSPPAWVREAAATERESLELLESLLDLTLNMFTGLDVVGARELRPAGTVRRLLESLHLYHPPIPGSMADRLHAAVVKRRQDVLTGISRQATIIAKRLGRDRSSASACLRDLWRQVGSLAGLSAELDLRTLSSELNAAMSGPLRGHVGHGDPVRFQDDILMLTIGGEGERTKVLKRWATQIERTWSPKNPRVRRCLLEARQPKLKREAIYAGLWEAVTDSNRPQRVKLGREWIKDHAQPIDRPGPMHVRPARYLTRWMGPEQYWLWLRRQAIARAEQYILEVPDDWFVEKARRFERHLRAVRLAVGKLSGSGRPGARHAQQAPISGAARPKDWKVALSGLLEDVGLQGEQAPHEVGDDVADSGADDGGTGDLIDLLDPSPEGRQILEALQRPEVAALPVRKQRGAVARLLGRSPNQVGAQLSKLRAKASKRGIRPGQFGFKPARPGHAAPRQRKRHHPPESPPG